MTGIRLDRFNKQNEMRNIDAKIEGIGFLIAKNEGELENLRIPVGGYVKLQDSGKTLERTANGFVEYSGGGGSVDSKSVVRLMYGQDYNNDFNNDFNN